MPDGHEPTLAELADCAANAVRSLNHRTFPLRDEIADAAEVSAIIANIKLMAERLPQLFGQLSRWLEHANRGGKIAHDTRRDASVYVTVACRSLGLAEADAMLLAAELNTAHNASSGLLTRTDRAKGNRDD